MEATAATASARGRDLEPALGHGRYLRCDLRRRGRDHSAASAIASKPPAPGAPPRASPRPPSPRRAGSGGRGGRRHVRRRSLSGRGLDLGQDLVRCGHDLDLYAAVDLGSAAVFATADPRTFAAMAPELGHNPNASLSTASLADKLTARRAETIKNSRSSVVNAISFIKPMKNS